MATPGRQNAPRGGYDCEFVQLPQNFHQVECSICILVLRSPHLASCCGSNFCKDCIERVQNDGRSCPLCNTREYILTYNRAFDVDIKELEVYCSNRKNGCDWTGKLKELDKHLNVDPTNSDKLEGCPSVEVQCCHNGCGQFFQRRVIAKHQSDECPHRPFTCGHCHTYKATYQDVTTNHWPVCKCYPVLCPNECTLKTIQYQHLQQHLSKECPLQEIECDFKYAGCNTKVLRKNIAGHLSKNMSHHLSFVAGHNQNLAEQLAIQRGELTQQIQIMAEKVLDLTAKLEAKEEQFLKLRKEMDLRLSQVETRLPHLGRIQLVSTDNAASVHVVMTNFEQHMRDKDTWFSEGFYTHPQGYKMCLGVNANGEKLAKGSHMSCHIYRMRGDFDDQLKWPFRAEITIQLLDQGEYSNHYTRTVSFNEDSPEKHTARVVDRERVTSGWWKTDKFIPHCDLHGVWGSLNVGNCKYLQNDCLYFKVSVRFS